jgi:hypothetical protein
MNNVNSHKGSTWRYPSRPYLRSDLLLGTLIHDIHSPPTDALKIFAPISGTDCSRHDDTTVTTSGLAHLNSAEKRSIARVFLGAATASESSIDELTITAHHGFIYSLWYPGRWLNKLCADPRVRTWLEEGYGQRKEAWMIVGCKTIVDADFVAEEREAGRQDSREEEEEWAFPGERIYALQVTKVEMRFFERREGEVRMRGPVWESHSKVLGGEGELETVEASLDGVNWEEEDENDDE